MFQKSSTNKPYEVMSLGVYNSGNIIPVGRENNNAQMPSPSKLAAQRIYSPPRNHISFHSALQGCTDELLTKEQPNTFLARPEPVKVEEAMTREQTVFQNSMPLNYPIVQQNANDSQIHVALQENDRQFKLVQNQIDLLRMMVLQMSQTKREAAPLTPLPLQAAALTPLPQQAAALTPLPQQPATPIPQQQVPQPATGAEPTMRETITQFIDNGKTFVSTHIGPEQRSLFGQLQNCFSCAEAVGAISWWQVLLFSVIFIVGLVQIICWLIEKLTSLFSSFSRQQQQQQQQSTSRSRSFSRDSTTF